MINLAFTGDAACGYGDAEYPYVITIEGEQITFMQIGAGIAGGGITAAGEYDPTTGAFTVAAPDLPGTEIYEGTIQFDGTTITVAGTYTYVDDPNQSCEGLWDLFGETEP